ncbi:hypothetical protein O4160_03310 [Rhodococcus sp. IEGM 1401]|uniref:hypothetical protein n=1 Tax=unclassified Rhodococcus (in: high G+C Gram-positive bacteria) TaxID=192944 RepID=UPI0022B3B538|nr:MULTISPECIES: hypothetical protein [unclassified Rhodococcus (in: high G+C Gram-positive bacteria)]MCZ4559861.1 hypothetical protein [Rhodococcus sp. IEGM 1401]MDI9920095.1 hypothetical protein [Rhodococcus sp. IEGM 1372]MDV8032442.1 hypothetical protein [Rhodococcus sp. IEGM 1414]
MTTDNAAEGTEVSLIVPATCPRGHVLEPRTVTLDIRIVQHTRTSRRLDAVGWRCVCCVRADVFTAHTGQPAPAEILRADNFCRQQGWSSSSGWHKRVRFGSGRQFTDRDDTPDKTDKKKRNPNVSHFDPTSSAALRGVNVQRRAAEPTWRDFLDPYEVPTESDRHDVEELGLDAWRDARAYRRYRQTRHGNAA